MQLTLLAKVPQPTIVRKILQRILSFSAFVRRPFPLRKVDPLHNNQNINFPTPLKRSIFIFPLESRHTAIQSCPMMGSASYLAPVSFGPNLRSRKSSSIPDGFHARTKGLDL
jgi:hypothetical protein